MHADLVMQSHATSTCVPDSTSMWYEYRYCKRTVRTVPEVRTTRINGRDSATVLVRVRYCTRTISVLVSYCNDVNGRPLYEYSTVATTYGLGLLYLLR